MPTNNNEIQKHQPQIKVSIDRLTVVGDFPTDLFMDHYYKWQREHDFVRENVFRIFSRVFAGRLS